MEASTAKAAALKARAEQGEVAQGRLCLATGAQGSSNASPGPAPAAPAAAASVGAQQEEGSSGTVNHVALEDLERAVAAAYQRCGYQCLVNPSPHKAAGAHLICTKLVAGSRVS